MKRISTQEFGKLKDGTPVQEFTLTNNSNMSVSFLNLGCTLTQIRVPDHVGRFDDVILGFDSPEAYLGVDNPYFGCIIGRTANRIAQSNFSIKDKEYPLSCNHGLHHLHGGTSGFDKKIWKLEEKIENNKLAGLRFSLISPHLDEGYPGNLSISTFISLDSNNNLAIEYQAQTDMTTVVNLTHHPYFNLTGKAGESCLNHELTIHSKSFTESDQELIFTGKIFELDGMALDFRNRQPIGARIDVTEFPMQYTGGYDHNYIIDDSQQPDIQGCRTAAELYDPLSRRSLVISTTQPCVQFYSGNFIPKGLVGKNQAKYFPNAGLCLEPQGYPDADRHKNFKSNILEPAQAYRETINYHFGIK